MGETKVSRKERTMTAGRVLIAVGALACTLGAFVYGQDTGIDNARVIKMIQLPLDDDVIIAKIKNSKCSFQLADSDLVELKKAGVPAKVVAAMLEANAVTVARVRIDKKPVDLHTLSLFKTAYSYRPFGRSSGIKTKTFLQGKHSSVVAGQSPEIILELPKTDTIDNYVIVQLDGKEERRELEMDSSYIVTSTAGISPELIHKTSATPLGENRFKLNLDAPLKPGEYFIFVVGTYDSTKGVYAKGYDFTVQ
jgi:hypothetical protein